MLFPFFALVAKAQFSSSDAFDEDPSLDPEATWPDTDSVYRNNIVITVIDPDDQFALIPCINLLNNEDLSTEIILIIH